MWLLTISPSRAQLRSWPEFSMCAVKHTQVSSDCEEDEQERKRGDVWQEACNILTEGRRG